MRAVLQRVQSATVTVEGEVTGSIAEGLLLFLGCGEGDGAEELEYLVEKSINLRIFADESGRMNLSLLDVGGSMLVVSQFTLYADTRRGRRPSFINAMKPGPAEELYEQFVESIRRRGIDVATGVFGAMMEVELVNDGPVTILLDTEDR